MDKVSIVLPTRNGAQFLRQAVESCLNQTHKNIELVIVDDGSTDETPAIIQGFADTRIKVLTQAVSLGLPRALNAGFAATTGSYLTWTSDDNYYAPEAIERMLAVLKSDESVDFTYARCHIIDTNGAILRSLTIKEPRELDSDNCIGACFLYRRKVYQKIGNYNPAAFLAEDYEYWLRVREEFRMKMVNDLLYYYREHDTSLTAKYTEKAVQEQVAKVRDPFIPAWKRYYFRGKRSFYSGECRAARSPLLKAAILNPLHYETWRLLALSVLDASLVELLKTWKRSSGCPP